MCFAFNIKYPEKLFEIAFWKMNLLNKNESDNFS